MLCFLEVVFDETVSSSGIVVRAEISSLGSSRFIRAFTTRTLVTCCSVNTVLIYLMKLILASRCVLYLSCAIQVLFFCSVVIMFSSSCFIDDTVLVEGTGKTGFAIVDNGEFCCTIGSHGELFGVVDNGIVISDIFRGGVKEFDDGE